MSASDAFDEPDGSASAHAVPRRAFALGLAAIAISRAVSASARTIAPEPPETRSLAGLRFERVVEAAVHSVALGPKGDVAAIGEGAWLRRSQSNKPGFERLPDPKVPLAGASVYLGRDHLPRLMGSAPNAAPEGGVVAIYRRFRNGTWIPAPKELGSLAEPDQGALEGILGDDDPEIVVKVGKQCLVKRRTGWTPLPALPAPGAYAIAGGEGWAHCNGQLLHFAKKAVVPVGSTSAFQRARALAASSPSAMWALSLEGSGRSELFAFDGQAWRFEPCPVAEPRAMTALPDGTLWLGGVGELCRWQSGSWQRAELRTADGTALGEVRSLAARNADAIWIASSTGLWHSSPEGSQP
jgi:hypothetical protein